MTRLDLSTGYRNATLFIWIEVALLLLVCTVAGETTDYSPRATPVISCRPPQDSVETNNTSIIFTYVAPCSPYNDSCHAHVEDPATLGGYRIHVPFRAPDNSVIPASVGFDPCMHTTCRGVTCLNDNTVLQFPAEDFPAYAENGTALVYPPYQTDPLRCGCAWNGAKPRALPEVYVDPAGPAAEANDVTTCGHLMCSLDPAQDALFYVRKRSTGVDGVRPNGEPCECCRKQSDILAPLPTHAPRCGELQPIARPPYPYPAPPVNAVVPDTVYGFFTAACPSSVTAGIPRDTVDAHQQELCCDEVGIANSRVCGEALLYLPGPTLHRCHVPSSLAQEAVGDAAATCCAMVYANKAVSDRGSYCDAVSQGDSAQAPLLHGRRQVVLHATVVALMISCVLLQ